MSEARAKMMLQRARWAATAFASYDGERTLPRIAMRLAVIFGGGQVREGNIVYPDHGLIGANLGPLRGLSVDEIVGFCWSPERP